jgi:hypothetical protein
VGEIGGLHAGLLLQPGLVGPRLLQIGGFRAVVRRDPADHLALRAALLAGLGEARRRPELGDLRDRVRPRDTVVLRIHGLAADREVAQPSAELVEHRVLARAGRLHVVDAVVDRHPVAGHACLACHRLRLANSGAGGVVPVV